MSTPPLPPVSQTDLADVAAAFKLGADFVDGQPHGHGLINDTFAIRTTRGGEPLRFVFQRINHRVFKDVPALMENIRRVTDHISAKPTDAAHQPLRIIRTQSGDAYHRDASNCFWRCYNFIEGATSHDALTSPDQARAAAAAFGEFQRDLVDLSGPRLHETIPNFHHTPKRFADLREAIRTDPVGRVAVVGPEVDFALKREPLTHALLAPHERGEIPERVTHNDTKISNVMLDDNTGAGVCVIDLDTVMPGLALYDFGDLVRSATNPCLEDELDLGKVRTQLPIFEQLVAGYLGSARSILNEAELAHLVVAGRLLAFEVGIRFLGDYLLGDVYYKTKREHHNLDRARGQFTLLRSMEETESEMQRIVDRYR